MILLDTNIISEILKADPDPKVTRWFSAQTHEVITTSAIVVMELRFGIGVLPDGARKQALAADIDRILANIIQDNVLVFDENTALEYAKLAARLKSKGVVTGQSDMMIAATALQHGATVATRNIKHFRPCGVSVANPFEGP